MTVPDYRDPRLTEQRNPRTERIDVASSLEIVDLLNAEDATVAGAVRAVRSDLARAIDLVWMLSAGAAARLRGRRHLRAAGRARCERMPADLRHPAGNGRGGDRRRLPGAGEEQRSAEDDVNAGMAAIDQARVAPADFVLGIAASGTTPFVRAALARAQTIGATTGLLSCSDPPRVLVETCDVLILRRSGPRP